MHANRYWQLFLSVLACCVLSYAAYTGFRLYHYLVLNKRIEVTDINWSVHSMAQDDYRLEANYQFIFGQQIYKGHDQWSEYYLNRWAAQESLNRVASTLNQVWINSHHPNYSALQKEFPFKECVSLTILIGLLMYFFLLGRYVRHLTDLKK